MNTKSLFEKCFVIGVLVLVCLPTAVGFHVENSTGTSRSGKTLPTATATSDENVTIIGSMGEDGWYNDVVILVFDTYNGTYRLFYSFDGVIWFEYTGPVVIYEDGLYTLYYYFIDPDGYVEGVHGPICFKLDRTPPAMNNLEIAREPLFTWKFTADITDGTSGVSRVELYFNSKLVDNSSAPGPYVTYWKGSVLFLKLMHVLAGQPSPQWQLVCYDVAGNKRMSYIFLF